MGRSYGSGIFSHDKPRRIQTPVQWHEGMSRGMVFPDGFLGQPFPYNAGRRTKHPHYFYESVFAFSPLIPSPDRYGKDWCEEPAQADTTWTEER